MRKAAATTASSSARLGDQESSQPSPAVEGTVKGGPEAEEEEERVPLLASSRKLPCSILLLSQVTWR